MYEKPSASNKVFLIRQLVNTKMKEGAFVADHENEFNSIVSSCSRATVTAVSGSTRTTKLKFDSIRDLILKEDIQRVLELFVKLKRQRHGQKARQRAEAKQRRDFQNQYPKLVASKDKEVHMVVRDYDNTLVRVVDDKTLDIASIGDVVLKTSFGTSWTLKDVSIEFIEYCAENMIMMLKTVSKTPQQNGVAKRMNHTLNERAKSTRLHVRLPKKDAMAQMRWDIAFRVRRVTRSSKAKMSHLMRTIYMEPRLQQILSPGGSSDTCKGSKNSGSFEDSGRLDEEDSKDGSFSKEGGSETLQTWSLIRLPAGKKALQSKWVFKVKEEQDGNKRLRHGRDQKAQEGTLRLSHEKYIGKVLEKFNMKDAEARCQLLGDHFKLSEKQTPKTEASRRRMAKVPHTLAVGGVIYAMGALGSCQVTAMLLERIQKYVAMSTTEAEYMAIVKAEKELNLVFHGQTKHIKIRYHYIRELVSEETLSIKKILGAKNPADMLTKVVTIEKLKLCAASTGLRDN
uniref:Retrovirus-related Pol polyprotein from transposon TNT 1-94 n=1 Tax=Tanacetum cinerariifolium TaxID=118510 RepID=A0A6L2K6C0_TANCI|nr:retrovirus-related Pol polyprotein from transposon TNT 1-94 [Tanacetum cinerariifolium]